MVIVNAGSHITSNDGAGWTNTYATAVEHARAWYAAMVEEGFADIELILTDEEDEGRWLFQFKHTVTGAVVNLWHHGIDNLDAYRKDRHIAYPRRYWKGSSDAVPKLSDFAAPGFTQIRTYVPTATTD